MQKNTKIIIVVAILAFAAGAWYYSSVNKTASISYDYEWETYSYYIDDEGMHYAPSGSVYAYAYITEVSTGNKEVLALPTCFTFVDSDGVKYECFGGHTDCKRLYPGESADIMAIYEIPSSVKSGHVEWNMFWIEAKLVNL